MAALVEGHNYGLSSRTSTSAGKSVVHVKLTDSALRAIEEFQKIKDVTSRRPSIKFTHNNGVIRVPIKKSSDNPEGYRTFSFTLSAIQGDPKGSFDCVQQSVSRHGEQLELLGGLSQKLAIQATDDVYRTTKEKMTLAEEENKKACAKEIKPSGRYIGKRVKKVVRRSDLEHLPPQKTRSELDSYASHKSGTDLSSSSASGHHHMAMSYKKSSISHRSTNSSSSQHQVSSSQRSSHSPQYPVVSSNSGSSSAGNHKTGVPSPSQPSGKSSPNPAVYNLPYRDRVIHLLAVRPFKKPELLARLQRDGVREKDKSSLSSTLSQVAVFNPRDNSYSLNKHLYAEVRPDWPGYTDADKQLLKRRMPHESNSAGSSPVTLSPAHSVSSQGSPTSSQKRPTSTTDLEPQPSKKQRIAHVKKEKERERKIDVSPVESGGLIKQEATTTTQSPDSSLDERKENHHNNNNLTAKSIPSSTSESPAYIMKYTHITSSEQRMKYKHDFNAEYEEYRQMHSNIEKVTKKFKELETSLREQVEGTDDYENIKNKILTEYKTVKKDPKYIDQRKRCDYLHKKLGHIKKLILEYDQAQIVDS